MHLYVNTNILFVYQDFKTVMHTTEQEQWNTCVNKLNVNWGNVLAVAVRFLTWLVCTLPSLHTHCKKRRQAHCSVGVSPWQHWPHAVTGNLGRLLWWVAVTSNLSPSCHGTTPTGSAAISVWCLEPTGNGVTMSHFHAQCLFLCSPAVLCSSAFGFKTSSTYLSSKWFSPLSFLAQTIIHLF